MSNGNGHRWSKFWWCDWQNDKSLQACSFAARGLWVELLGLCHGSERPGYLLVNGEPPTVEELADMLGKATPKEITKLLDELERRRIFSRDEHGTIYSRRMVRDAAASEEGREHIAKRWNGKNTDPPNRGANRSPDSQPTRKPNGEARSPPISPPITQKLEAEAEAEEPPQPPLAEGGLGGLGNSQRKPTNPRALGTNPRGATTPKPKVRNGFNAMDRPLEPGPPTIDGTAEEFEPWLASLRRIAND